MTNQEKEKAAFQSVYDSGTKAALQDAWEVVNVLGAPKTARITDHDKSYCAGIEDALRAIEELQDGESGRIQNRSVLIMCGVEKEGSE